MAGSLSQAEMDSCVSYLRFPVSHIMAPFSRLLVYYVRENGEGVTDSLQISVQPELEHKVFCHFCLYSSIMICSAKVVLGNYSECMMNIHTALFHLLVLITQEIMKLTCYVSGSTLTLFLACKALI